MMKNLRILYGVMALAFAVIITGCGGQMSTESIEESIRQAEEAVAMGDMAAAQSVASYITADTNLLSATQMARLSMVYMQMADSIDQEGNTNIAADYYDMAIHVDADSANIFYQNIEPGRLQYVETLANHSANRSNPADIANMPFEMDSEEYGETVGDTVNNKI